MLNIWDIIDKKNIENLIQYHLIAFDCLDLVLKIQ